MPEPPPGSDDTATWSLARRRARLSAALRTLRDEPTSPVGVKLASWLNTWKGVGAIVDGMTAQGYDLELMQQPHGWWARFYLSSASHPVCAGSGWAVTPWDAVQAAAWETLTTGNPEARLQEQLAAPGPKHPSDPRGGPAGALRATRSPDPPAGSPTAGSSSRGPSRS
jgi:hypothetical protein